MLSQTLEQIVLERQTVLSSFRRSLIKSQNGWQGFVPIGTYMVSSGLVISSKTAIRIVGAAGGSFGSPILSWASAAGATVISLQGTSYSSLEHLFILESNNGSSGPGRIGICIDTDTSPSSRDRFEDIQCGAPSIAGC